MSVLIYWLPSISFSQTFHIEISAGEMAGQLNVCCLSGGPKFSSQHPTGTTHSDL